MEALNWISTLSGRDTLPPERKQILASLHLADKSLALKPKKEKKKKKKEKSWDLK